MGTKRTKAQQKRFLEKQQKRRTAIKRVSGILGNLTGFLTEQRFFEAFQNTELPTWLHKIRKSGKRLDQFGIDAIAETDCGLFYLQIKSSEERGFAFSQNSRTKHIPVVVTLKGDSPEYIRYQTINILQEARSKKLQRKNCKK